MTNWCENLVTISNDDRRVIKEIENAFERDELLDAFIPCPRRRNNHGSRSPITGRHNCGNRESRSGDWIDPMETPLNWSCRFITPRVSRSETATPTPRMRRWHWPGLLAAARTL